MKINKIDKLKWMKSVETCNESKMSTRKELKLIKIIFSWIKKIILILKFFLKLTEIKILADGGKKFKKLFPFNF